MNIRDVKTAIKIGEFKLEHSVDEDKLHIEYVKGIDKSILYENSARVYILTSNGIIKKIGGSESSGGIKSTMDFYENAQSGNPGSNRYILNLLIINELKKGKKVELYLIKSNYIKARITGLFGSDYEKTSITFKSIEKKCLDDYYKVEGRYPEWNFQENKEKYPDDLAKAYLDYKNKHYKK